MPRASCIVCGPASTAGPEYSRTSPDQLQGIPAFIPRLSRVYPHEDTRAGIAFTRRSSADHPGADSAFICRLSGVYAACTLEYMPRLSRVYVNNVSCNYQVAIMLPAPLKVYYMSRIGYGIEHRRVSGWTIRT